MERAAAYSDLALAHGPVLVLNHLGRVSDHEFGLAANRLSLATPHRHLVDREFDRWHMQRLPDLDRNHPVYIATNNPDVVDLLPMPDAGLPAAARAHQCRASFVMVCTDGFYQLSEDDAHEVVTAYDCAIEHLHEIIRNRNLW